MIKKLYLHIGTPKTGTTSIQKSLCGYNDGKTLYFEHKHIKNNGNHSHVATAFASIPRKLLWGIEDSNVLSDEALFNILEDVRNDLRRTLIKSNHESLIISSEAFCLLDEEGCDNFFSFIKEINNELDIKIISYLREPKSFCKSEFQQRIKRHLSSEPFSIPDKIRLHYKTSLKKFTKHVDKASFITKEFDKEKLINGCVVQDICKIIGIKLKKIINLNEGINIECMKIVNLLNHCVVTYGSEARYSARLKFIEIINAAYSNSGSINNDIFGGMYDIEEIIFCKNEFGIDFTDSIIKSSSKNKLKDLINDLSNISHGPIKNILLDMGIQIDGNFTINDYVIKLYEALYNDEPKKNYN